MNNGLEKVIDARLPGRWSRSGAFLAALLLLGALILLTLLTTFLYDVVRDNSGQIATIRAAADRNYQLILETKTQTQMLRDLRFRIMSDSTSFRKELDSLRAENADLRKDIAALLRDLDDLRRAKR